MEQESNQKARDSEDNDHIFVPFSKHSQYIKRTVISLWLGFLYVLCTSLVMSSLSGSLFQEKLRLIKKNRAPETIEISLQGLQTLDGTLISSGIFDQSIRQSKNAPVKTNPDSIIDYNSTYENSNGEDEYYSLDEIVAGFDRYEVATSTYDIIKYLLINPVEKKAMKDQIYASIINLEKLIEELQDKNEKDSSKNQSKDEKSESSNNREARPKEIDFVRETLDKKMATLDAMQLNDNYPKLIPVFLEVKSFNSFFQPIKTILKIATFGTLNDHFWTYPRPILKLNLILSMGILGSLIFVTIEFIRDPLKHSLEMYLFRPFLGMIIALAMYVLLKSGQTTISNGIEKDLSPFFISFLGIISGMLAEQAYRRISFSGKTLFNFEGEGNVPPPNNIKEGN